jgi:aspartate 1-decarboxylase
MRWFLRSKIHKATVTDTDINYVGSLGIDKALTEKSGILAGEKVLVVDNTNGARLETYVVEEEYNSGKIIIYGAACRLIKKGDEVIIMGFELSDNPVEAKKVLVDKDNGFVKFL